MERDNFEYVNDFYKENSATLDKYVDDLSRSLNIPKVIIRHTIKRILVEVFFAKKTYIQKRNIIVDSVLAIMTFIYLFILSLNPFYKAKKKLKYDLGFEKWIARNTYTAFYKDLHRFLLDSNYSTTVMKLSPKTNDEEYLGETDEHLVRSNYVFSRKVSAQLLRSILSMSVKSLFTYKAGSINFLRLTLFLYRYVLLYETESENVNIKVLFSAADNYYSALRYHIYKKNGIENILLLQNGYRTGRYSDYGGETYTYCDHYYGYGKKTIDVQAEMHCDEKVAIGSIKAFVNLEKQKENLSKLENTIDVVFADGAIREETSKFSRKEYFDIVENLMVFAKEHPHLNIVFRVKPNIEVTPERETQFRRLKEAGITVDSSKEHSTYEVILQSKVVLFYTSTVGVEAICLNKKVLHCNYRATSLFYSNKDDIGCLVDSSYDAFKHKVQYLLNEDSEVISDYYNNLKVDYMNLDLDTHPFKVIADNIKKLV